MSLLQRVDHLVFATNDLEASCAELERRLGVRPSPGGQHLGRGTRNALVALGPRAYLEIIGPDPAQPAAASPRWFDVERVTTPKLVAWAVRVADVTAAAAEAARHGIHLGASMRGSRRRADGVLLTWTFTDPAVIVAGGLVPFFIDWDTSPHPSASAAGGVELVAFSAEHPEPEQVHGMLHALALDLEVNVGPAPALIATIRTAAGMLLQVR